MNDRYSRAMRPQWTFAGLALWACVSVTVGCDRAQEPPPDPAPASQGSDADEGAGPGAAPTADPRNGAPTATDYDTHWPRWRGPDLNNVAPADQDPPIEWSETKNVVWRISLPGRGHATPCIVGGRIFLPAGDEKAKAIWMLCFDRRTGKQLWRRQVWRGELAKIHRDNSHASATPACDGRRVYFPYQTRQSVRLAALGLEGKILWNEDVAKYASVQGFSASPALHGSSVIVATDGGTGSGPTRLTAMDRRTGKVLWRVPRHEDESYASPLVARVAGRDQLLIIGPDRTRSYDPNSGAPLWACDGPAKYNTATPAFAGDMVYATGGYPEKALLGIRADGSGDVTATHRVFKSDEGAGYVPSPLVHDGLIYAVSDKGLMRCYDAATGAVVWERDLAAPFYSSPVLVGKRVYVFDRKGKGYVLAAGREFQLLATNSLSDGAFATPVILDGRIYLRSMGDFYCLGEK